MLRILYIFLIISFGCSCSKQLELEHNREAPPLQVSAGGDSSIVGILFFVSGNDNITKSGIEDDIYNLNVFLYNKQFNTLKHTYLTSGGTLNIKIVNGDYEIYCIANINRNLSDLSYANLKTLRNTINKESDITVQNRMLMSTVQEVSVNRNTVFTIPIPLKRLAAKVTFNISLTAAMAVNSKIVYIQLCAVNHFTYYFADSRAGGYVAYDSYNVESQNLQRLSKTYYVMENKAGINSAIMAHYQRTEANAPTGSTYLFIRLKQDNQYIDYRVYLGENITNDFNICRNKNYTYNIRIIGSKPSNSPLIKSGFSNDFTVQTFIGI